MTNNNEFNKVLMNDLKEKQSWSLDRKVAYSKEKIVEFVEYMGGIENTYVSFSGGKDSCVLLHLVRSIYPNAGGVFFNTGLEYPEILSHVKTFENIEWRKPRKTPTQVWREYGVPVVSKEYSRYISDVREGGSVTQTQKRLNFRNSYSLPKKWIHFTDTEFFEPKVSNKCCDYFKKLPSKDYEKETGKYAFVGTMAEESQLRMSSWVKHSCNIYAEEGSNTRPQSRPLSIWTEKDIWEYIERYDVSICELYHKGLKRTGCFCCPYGAHLEDRQEGTNRFELLKESHPKHYKALDKMGIREALLNMRVPIRNDETYMIQLGRKEESIKEWYERTQKNIEENGENSPYWQYHKYFEPKTKK